jgi:alkylated DNA nucleotide flippase Atl1
LALEAPPPGDDEVAVPEGRGQRQRQILGLTDLGTESGMKTAEVAAAIGYEVPNTHSTLQALERAGLVEMIRGVQPQTWRLAPRYRNNAPVFARVASRIRAGEWATYGDISIAVRGDHKASRGVGRAAATMPSFPNPHRLLLDGGRIHPEWKSSDGQGPEECRRRLEAEGIRFDDEHRASAQHRVAWDTLLERDKTEPVPD